MTNRIVVTAFLVLLLVLGIAAVVAFRRRQSPRSSGAAIDDSVAITLGRFSVVADRLESAADRIDKAAEQEIQDHEQPRRS